MLAVLVTGPTAMQDSLFFSQRWLQPFATTYCTYPQRMARLSGPEWLGKYRDGVHTKGLQSQF